MSFPSFSINLLSESALLLAIICFSFGVLVLAKDFRDRLHQSYSVLTFVVFGWAFSFFLFSALSWRVFESLHLIFNLALGPVSMWFMQVLIQAKGKFFHYCIRLSFFLAIVLIPPVILGLDNYAWIRHISYFSPILILFSVSYLYIMEAFGFVTPKETRLVFSRRKNILQVLKRRNFGLYFGGAFVTLTCVMDRVPWMGSTIPALGNACLAIYFYFLMQVVLEGGYISFRRLSWQLLSNISCAIVIALSFFVVSFWVIDQIVLLTVNLIIVSYLVTLYASPLSKFFSILFQKILFKESHRIEDLIHIASQKLLNAFSLISIREVIDDFLENTLHVSIRAFYILGEEGKSFKKVYDAFPERGLVQEISVFYPILLYWKDSQRWTPIFLDELKRDATRITAEKDLSSILTVMESLKSLESDLVLPISHEKAILGFVTIRLESFPLGDWNRAWVIPMLEEFFGKLGKSLGNLDLYSNLRTRERLAVLGEMSAGLAHEIRNPLGAIKGAAEILKNAEEKETFMGIIIEEVDRLNNVVSRFLNYTKSFQGKGELVDLKKLAEKTLESFIYKIKGEGLDMEIELSAQESMPLAYCQSDLISQVILNLLENAKKALMSLQQRKASLLVRVGHEGKKRGGSFSIEVLDNGEGMGEESLEKAFIPFYTASQDGTGMGLPISQRIAEVHAGNIELYSEKGKGTVAKLRFPSGMELEERKKEGIERDTNISS